MTLNSAFGVAGALVFGMAGLCFAQDKPQEAVPGEMKLNKAELSQYQALTTLVDAVVAGKEPAPSDVSLKFQNHFVKSASNIFVPYILEVGSSKLSSFPVAMYVRAVRKAGTAAETEKGAAAHVFTDLAFFTDSKTLRSTGPATAEISRALELPPGEFDLYIAIAETPPRNAKTAAPAKRAVLRHAITVPDLSKGLTTSSVVLGKSLEEAPQPLSPLQQMEQPFTLGGYKITPTFVPTFSKSGELLFLFIIYNEGMAATGKPDLAVDYNIFRAAETKPFSKLATMTFDATTLPAEFSSSAGHQVLVGQGIPMERFAPGDYRLEIRITDKTNGQSILRPVPFTVAP